MDVDPLLRLDWGKAADLISGFCSGLVEGAGARGAVVGLSGGVDSSVTAALLVRALGPTRVLGAVMPDPRVTPGEDVGDALRLAESLGIETVQVDVSGPVDSLAAAIPGFDPGARVPLGNLRARVRMTVLYYLANSRGLLVAGTGDRSEILVGYFTKHGDGAADFLPIGDLYKTQVRALGEFLGLPREVVEKPSSPRLWPGQTAEGELGISYEVLDRFLVRVFDLGKDPEEAAGEVGMGRAEAARILEMHASSSHKRRPPPIPPVRETARA